MACRRILKGPGNRGYSLSLIHIWYIEIDLRAGMELPELKRKFGSKITFFGNLDCANLLSFGTPAQVKEHTKDCLRKGLGNGGHILCCNNAITESVPVANYRAIGEGYREFFGL